MLVKKNFNDAEKWRQYNINTNPVTQMMLGEYHPKNLYVLCTTADQVDRQTEQAHETLSENLETSHVLEFGVFYILVR